MCKAFIYESMLYVLNNFLFWNLLLIHWFVFLSFVKTPDYGWIYEYKLDIHCVFWMLFLIFSFCNFFFSYYEILCHSIIVMIFFKRLLCVYLVMRIKLVNKAFFFLRWNVWKYMDVRDRETYRTKKWFGKVKDHKRLKFYPNVYIPSIYWWNVFF